LHVLYQLELLDFRERKSDLIGLTAPRISETASVSAYLIGLCHSDTFVLPPHANIRSMSHKEAHKPQKIELDTC